MGLGTLILIILGIVIYIASAIYFFIEYNKYGLPNPDYYNGPFIFITFYGILATILYLIIQIIIYLNQYKL